MFSDRREKEVVQQTDHCPIAWLFSRRTHYSRVPSLIKVWHQIDSFLAPKIYAVLLSVSRCSNEHVNATIVTRLSRETAAEPFANAPATI